MKDQHPSKRTGRLIVREIPGEVLVYDLVRDKALCLNQTAAAVWNLCRELGAREEI